MPNFTPSSIISDAILAAELAQQYFADTAADAIKVIDSGNFQAFPNARPMRVDVTPRAKLMDHPLESGQITTDYKIILPLEIRMPVMIQQAYYRDTYQEIWNIWQTSELLTVQTRAGQYSNMIIAEPPHEEKPDQYDVITMNLHFRQVPIVGTPSNYFPANPVQADTTILGYQIPSIYTILGTMLGAATSAQSIAAVVR